VVSPGAVHEDALWYFAYGSNMCRAIFCERRGMQPLAARPARLDGYRLCFNLPIGPGERGVANLEPDPDASTHGVVYALTPAELDRLDRTEGVHVDLYRRVPVEVVADGERIAAYTYQSSRTVDGRKPSARYIGLLLAGAREHGLPPECVALLEAFELAIDERPPSE
jgi:cation transport regulator ChaC